MLDNGTLLRTTAMSIIRGLQNERGPNLAEMVCVHERVRSLKGKKPFRGTDDTLPRDLRRGAVGADPTMITGTMDSMDWDMGVQSLGFQITDEELEDLEEYEIDGLAEWGETVVEYSDVGMEIDLNTLLSNATHNNAEAVGAGFGAANSTPIEDFQDGISTYCPGADILVLGKLTAQKLCRHPDLKSKNRNYASADSLPQGNNFAALKAELGEQLSIPAPDIYVGETFLNTKAEGIARELGYTFGDFAWVGHRRGIRLLEQRSSGRVTLSSIHGVHEVVFKRVYDMQRPDKGLGLNFTGV